MKTVYLYSAVVKTKEPYPWLKYLFLSDLTPMSEPPSDIVKTCMNENRQTVVTSLKEHYNFKRLITKEKYIPYLAIYSCELKDDVAKYSAFNKSLWFNGLNYFNRKMKFVKIEEIDETQR